MIDSPQVISGPVVVIAQVKAIDPKAGDQLNPPC
jgi:hypothetical protein